MRVDWDEAKNKTNKAKHRVSFELARLVFDDPLHRSIPDRVVGDEVRWQTIGRVGGVLLLLVAHTWEEGGGDGAIRIISARKAGAYERKRYEEGSE